MKKNLADSLTTMLSTVGIYTSVQTINDILNLILLIISIVNIIIVVSIRCYEKYKAGAKPEEIVETIKQGAEQIDENIRNNRDWHSG